jgi:SAM-dependent methyltransferase
MNKPTSDVQYYALLGKKALAQHNAAYAASYRVHDENGVKEQWATHTDLGEFVSSVSSTFNRQIDVLDLACGCGRYFHCLKHVRSLVGVDLSPDMLEQAKCPVEADKLTFPITLLCQNIVDVEFPAKSFDMIYAVGIFSVCLPLDHFFLEKIFRMLRPGGKFAFTAADKNATRPMTWKRRVAQCTVPFLPSPLSRRLRARLWDLELSERDLRQLLTDSPFQKWIITHRPLPSGRMDFLCVAQSDNESASSAR